MPNKKMNYCNKPRMEAVRAMLEVGTEKVNNKYKIAKTYLDYGAGMEWETIIVTKENGDTYQLLNPRDWDSILIADSIMDLASLSDVLARDINRRGW